MLLKLEIGLCSVIHKGGETEFSYEKAGGKARRCLRKKETWPLFMHKSSKPEATKKVNSTLAMIKMTIISRDNNIILINEVIQITDEITVGYRIQVWNPCPKHNIAQLAILQLRTAPK